MGEDNHNKRMRAKNDLPISSFWSTARIMILALAIMLVPFSVSHSAINSKHDSMSSEHHISHTGSEHSHMNHGLESCDRCATNKGPHEEHNEANCCSSICGGALTVQSEAVGCMSVDKKADPALVTPLEPGEWVLPFRPPST